MGIVKPLPLILIVLVLSTAILFLTEVMSNTAVSNMLMPISIGFAAAISTDPFIIMGIVAPFHLHVHLCCRFQHHRMQPYLVLTK